jgi:HSP20 family protein
MNVRFERYPVARNAFGDVYDFEREVNSLFENFLGTPWGRTAGSGHPRLDVAESGEETLIVMELPGVKKEDLKVLLQDGMLTISGERKTAALPEKAKWIRNEVEGGSFSRAIELPHPVKQQEISAELNDGILRIHLPKAEEIRPREIRVK